MRSPTFRRLAAALFLLYPVIGHARLTAPSPLDRDAFCAGAKSLESCIDKIGDVLPTTDNAATSGSLALRWAGVYGVEFYGDGSFLTGVPSSSSIVGVYLPLVGGSLTGALTGTSITAATGTFTGASGLTTTNLSVSGMSTIAGTETVKGNAFSVGGSTFVVSGGGVAVGTTTIRDSMDILGSLGFPSSTGINFYTADNSAHSFIFNPGTTSGASLIEIGGGNVGISTAAPDSQFSVQGNAHINGQLSVTGPVPTLSSCGGGSPAVTAGSKNNIGIFVTGSAASSCTLNFSSAFSAAPVCIGQAINGASVAGIFVACASTTSCILPCAAATFYTYTCL